MNHFDNDETDHHSQILVLKLIDKYLLKLHDWQVVALVTPSRHPLKSVLDSRVNNGTPKRSQHSDLSTRTLLKWKQRSKRRSAPLNNLHQLMPNLVKSLKTSSPIHKDSPKEDDLLPTKHKEEVSVEDFVEKVVGRILKEVEKVWIWLYMY